MEPTGQRFHVSRWDEILMLGATPSVVGGNKFQIPSDAPPQAGRYWEGNPQVG